MSIVDDYMDDVDSVASTSRDFYPGLPNPTHSTNKTPCRTIASQQITLSNSKDANNIEIVPADYDGIFYFACTFLCIIICLYFVLVTLFFANSSNLLIF